MDAVRGAAVAAAVAVRSPISFGLVFLLALGGVCVAHSAASLGTIAVEAGENAVPDSPE